MACSLRSASRNGSRTATTLTYGPRRRHHELPSLRHPDDRDRGERCEDPSLQGRLRRVVVRRMDAPQGQGQGRERPQGGRDLQVPLPQLLHPRQASLGRVLAASYRQRVTTAASHSAAFLSDRYILSTSTTIVAASRRTAKRSMLRVARPEMNTPSGW